jgi:hypothetical protein
MEGGSYLSGNSVATDLLRPTQMPDILMRYQWANNPRQKVCLHYYLALHPAGFTEPNRSPGMLVSSYLTFSPLPLKINKGGIFSVALSIGLLLPKKQ